MKTSLLFLIATLALVSAAFLALQRPNARLPFRVWRAVSRDAHGGQYVPINDIRIYYETFGGGTPVLVLHGGGFSLEGMGNQIRALAPSYFVIAPDSRGQGRSTDSDAPLSYSAMADDMLRLLDRLHVRRADIVGWSDGGIIALDMAIHHPERVGRIVVIGADYDAAGLVAAGGAIAPDPRSGPVLYRKLSTLWATQPHYTLDELRGIEAPALIMAGEFDIVKREYTDQLARVIPVSEEFIVPGGTHGVIWDKRDLVNAKILQFLKK